MRAVLFDLDGTLLNTLDDLAEAVNFALRELGYAQRSRQEVRSFVGNGIRKLIERSLPAGADGETVERALALFRGYYEIHLKDHTRPYEGIKELLEELKEKGVPTAVVTNKFEAGARALTESCLAGLIGLTVGEGGRFPKKPAPDGVQYAMRYLETEEAVYVGDSPVDAETADQAGLPCILVDWGFADRYALEETGKKTICSDIAALKAALEAYIDG